MRACDGCVRRAWLVAALCGNLEIAWRSRKPTRDTLAMSDEALIEALCRERTTLLRRYDALVAAQQREAWESHSVAVICRHDPRYPERLGRLADAPAVLFCAGDERRLALVAGTATEGPPAVAVVGTRRPLPEADELARGLGRGLAGAGVTVVSGMAMGIDTAAHAGALDVGGPTIAVLACGPDNAYPRSKAALHRRLVDEQLVVSELPPGHPPWRWAFPARNRIIAALGRATIVVEGAQRSGSLITADFAAAMGRDVGACPGRAGSPRTRGGNGLLRDGAAVILGVDDALDLVLGPDVDRVAGAAQPADPALRPIMAAISAGKDSVGALASLAGGADEARLVLMKLELAGLVRRVPGDRYVAVARRTVGLPFGR